MDTAFVPTGTVVFAFYPFAFTIIFSFLLFIIFRCVFIFYLHLYLSSFDFSSVSLCSLPRPFREVDFVWGKGPDV